jgi:hypothetical protein
MAVVWVFPKTRVLGKPCITLSALKSGPLDPLANREGEKSIQKSGRYCQSQKLAIRPALWYGVLRYSVQGEFREGECPERT